MAPLRLHLLLLLLPYLMLTAFVGASNRILNDFSGGIPELPFIPKPEIPLPFAIPSIVGGVLAYDYYDESCPDAEKIIEERVDYWINKDPTLAPSLLRLHFVDCMIRGCDASILLNHEDSERNASYSKTLKGFDVIDDIKSELENKCPKTVSCADILAGAARDAVVKVGAPFWEVAYGRKDGLVSRASETEKLPKGNESITYLIELFQSRGLSLIDLVVLSGAHTIGRATCGAIQDRLYNYQGTNKPDPSMDPQYLNYLERKCRWTGDYADLDATTPKKFDNAYYVNIEKKMGLLSTDQKLLSDSRTGPLVMALADQPMLFRMQFPVSMLNLADTEVLTGDDEGEIRLQCSSVNP